MMNETAQQNMENHPVIRTLYDHVDEVTCLAFHQQNRSSPLVQGIILLNYLIIPNRLQKEPSNTSRWGMFGKELLFFFLKYSELMCDSSLSKSCLSGHPINNKEDALPATDGTVLVLSGTNFLWPLRTAGGQRDGSEFTSLFKGCRFLLKDKI